VDHARYRKIAAVRRKRESRSDIRLGRIGGRVDRVAPASNPTTAPDPRTRRRRSAGADAATEHGVGSAAAAAARERAVLLLKIEARPQHGRPSRALSVPTAPHPHTTTSRSPSPRGGGTRGPGHVPHRGRVFIFERSRDTRLWVTTRPATRTSVAGTAVHHATSTCPAVPVATSPRRPNSTLPVRQRRSAIRFRLILVCGTRAPRRARSPGETRIRCVMNRVASGP